MYYASIFTYIYTCIPDHWTTNFDSVVILLATLYNYKSSLCADVLYMYMCMYSRVIYYMSSNIHVY